MFAKEAGAARWTLARSDSGAYLPFQHVGSGKYCAVCGSKPTSVKSTCHLRCARRRELVDYRPWDDSVRDKRVVRGLNALYYDAQTIMGIKRKALLSMI